MSEHVFELHWQRREYGEVTCQLYERLEHGQLRLVDSHQQGPFESTQELAAWLTRSLVRDGVTVAK
jgi:hypothetical protein